MHRKSFFPLFSLLSLTSVVFGQEDWSQFRGPAGKSTAGNVSLPTSWGGVFDTPVWKTELPGRGWSSPVVIGDRIWVTAASELSMNTAIGLEKLAERPYGVDDFQIHASVQLFAFELDAISGSILRRIDLFDVDSPPPIHALNSYATPTPCSNGKLLCCHFGSLGTACLEIQSGKVLWKRTFNVEDITGSGSSPILYRGRVLLTCDGSDQQFVTALNATTGETLWETNRPAIDVSDVSHRRAFSTPLVIEQEAKSQLISAAAQWLVSYDLETGDELWKARICDGHATVPSPTYDDGMVYACTGFWKHELVAVRVNGSGDVTESHVAWRYGKQVPDVSSPLVLDGLIYFVSSIGIATCLDAKTGALVWQKRLGGNYSASPVAGRDSSGKANLYLTSREGVTTVIQAGREFQEVSKNTLYGETFASLAVHQNRLLIRTHPTLFCLRP